MATNKVLTLDGTTTTWLNTGGDKLMDLGGLTASTGIAMGAYLDLGVTPRTDRYKFVLFINGFDSAPQVGEIIELWFSQSDATTGFDGSPTTDPTASAEGTITAAQAKNCTYSGKAAIVYSVTAGDNLKITGEVTLIKRYVAPIVINLVADALLSTADAHHLKLTPLTTDVQAAA